MLLLYIVIIIINR